MCLSQPSTPSAKSPTFTSVTAQAMEGTQRFCLPNRFSGSQAGSLAEEGPALHPHFLPPGFYLGGEKKSRAAVQSLLMDGCLSEEATSWLAEGWLFIILLDPLHPAPGSQSPSELPFLALCRVFWSPVFQHLCPACWQEDCNSSWGPWEQSRVFKACHATVGATTLLGLVELTTSFP